MIDEQSSASGLDYASAAQPSGLVHSSEDEFKEWWQCVQRRTPRPSTLRPSALPLYLWYLFYYPWHTRILSVLKADWIRIRSDTNQLDPDPIQFGLRVQSWSGAGLNPFRIRIEFACPSVSAPTRWILFGDISRQDFRSMCMSDPFITAVK